jgi:hypothetical protein
MTKVGLMARLAAEPRDTNIHVNPISLVAATRVLRRSGPELPPELAAPCVAARLQTRQEDDRREVSASQAFIRRPDGS